MSEIFMLKPNFGEVQSPHTDQGQAKNATLFDFARAALGDPNALEKVLAGAGNVDGEVYMINI